jgi:putative peptidoglycan lipid II flippase
LPGWGWFSAKVALATLLLAGFLLAAANQFDWLGARQQVFVRLSAMALVLITSAILYFACLRLCGLRLKSFVRR